jgi:hypothetical protein
MSPNPGNGSPRPTMYKRSIDIPESLRDQMCELAQKHDRTLADEIRHALRVYVAVSKRRKREAA